ncbi:MAG: phosphoglycerate dehydrogenase [Mariprofundales bacterium]
MTQPKVWIADKMSERAIAVFKENGIDVDYRPGLSAEEKLTIAGQYDGIAVRSSTTLKGDLLASASNVRVIGRAGIGVDNIDIEACSRRGIVVMNTPFGNAITTAELAIAHLLAAARRIPQANASTRAGLWEKAKFMGMELTGKKAGVIGCGNIGKIVCDRLKGLRMHVYVYDPFVSKTQAEQMGVHVVNSVAELADIVDVLSVHTPLLAATRNIVNADILARMQGGIVINCARGGVVDEDALYQACNNGDLFAAAVDVYAKEPARENALFTVDNITCSPHIGASSVEAQENVAVQVAEQMSDYLMRGAVSNAINMPSMSAAEQQSLQPYLHLAERLGNFLGQYIQTPLSEIQISLEGQAADNKRKPIVNTLIHHLLATRFEDVNAINASFVAGEHGIEIIQNSQPNSDHFKTLLRVKTIGDEGEHCITGTLFDGNKSRLVSLDGFEVEMPPVGRLLCLRNTDLPGVVAGVGRVLAEASINIGDFRLGRHQQTRNAMALVSVDSTPNADVLAQLAALTHMLDVRYVALDS